MSTTTQRICRRCLLRDMAEQDPYENLFTYVKNLAPEEKVPDAVYERRLALCRDCEKLMSGTCILCGCYVELRAAMRVRSCPALPARWGKYEGSEKE